MADTEGGMLEERRARTQASDTRETTARTLSELLRRRAAASPARAPVTFLHDDGSEDPVTLAGLDAAASSVAGVIAATGIPAGSPVLLPFLPGRDFLTAFWGTTRAGMIAVPVSPPVTPRLADRFRDVADDCGPALTLTSADLAPLLHHGNHGAATVTTIDQLPAAASSPNRRAIRPDDPAYLQYTSGTSGPPRGAVITHAQALATCAMAAAALRLTPAHTFVQWLPEWHDMGLLSQVLQPVYGPYRVHVMSPAAFSSDPVRLLEEMSARKGYGTAMPYGAYELLVKRAGMATSGRLARARPDRWQFALVGADTADGAALRRLTSRLAAYGLADTAMHAAYGSAEANIICADRPGSGLKTISADYQSLVRDGRLVPRHSTGVELAGSGEPVRGVDLRILDAAGVECPDGTVGEIAVGGPGVATRYWKHPAQTVQLDGHRLLLTGDLGLLHGGELFHLGRKCDVIADAQGRNHPAWLVESAASRAHQAVHGRVLAAFQSAGKAVFVAETDRSARADEVAAAIYATVYGSCGLLLDDVLLVPRRTIPLTTSGKVRRGAARQMYEDRQLMPLHLSEMAR